MHTPGSGPRSSPPSRAPKNATIPAGVGWYFGRVARAWKGRHYPISTTASYLLMIRGVEQMVPRQWAAALVVGLLGVVSCTLNPATGRRELSLVSESQEIAMGSQGAQETLAAMPLVADPAAQSYLRDVAARMVAVAERPTLPWTFHLLDDASVNAFAYPGGYIFITRGILTHMNNEAELAGVLGHEIGHVTARHTASQITKSQLAGLGMAVTTIVSPEVGAMLGATVGQGIGMLFLKFSRDHEYQADELGFRYITREGYDPRAMSTVFTMLQRQGAAGGGGRLPEWQSTHPDPANRVDRNDQRVATLAGVPDSMTLGRDRFLQHLNGMVFGEDPRQGYFEGERFNHPELRFRFAIPAGWKGSNQPASVIGVSPERDAIVALALAKGSSPAAALREFLGQQGIQAGATSGNPVNGHSAALGEFTAATEQGTVSGAVEFIHYDGRLYQLLGYTPLAKAAGHAASFRQFFGSFATLTDRVALNRQPDRIRVVRLPRGMTVEEFHRQYPSVIPVERVALLNGFTPGQVLPRGTLAKQVR